MRLSPTTFAIIALLALPSSSSLASSSAVDVVGSVVHRSSSSRRPHRDMDVMMRMLQAKEGVGSSSSSQQRPTPVGRGGGGGNNNNNNNNNEKKNKNKARSSSMLDYNHHNIILDKLEYDYGSPISISFELNNDLDIDETVLYGLNVTNSASWEIGLFMRMADPQGGALKPITTVKPTLSNLGTGGGGGAAASSSAAASRSLRRGGGGGGRDLQQTTVVTAPTTNSRTNATTYDILANMPQVSTYPPVLNYTGIAIIPGTKTSPTFLNPKSYGTGFDIYLLDQNGGAIIGPATFYMVATRAMNDGIIAEMERVPKNNGLSKFDDGRKKAKENAREKKDGKKGNGKGPDTAEDDNGKDGKERYDNDDAEHPSDAGLGSGTNGDMVIGTSSKLSDYVLTTSETTYPIGSTSIVVTYDLGGTDLSALGRRRRVQGNGNKRVTTTTTTTTTTRATVAGGTTTTRATVAGGTTTTTTTKATTVASGGPPPSPIPPPAPDAIDRLIDGSDIKLFRLGVYMRMANPQDGKLSPILSMPFCPTSGTSCNKTPKQLMSGTFEFGIAGLDVDRNGYGYDLWVLNGMGVGVAGPHTFYVENPDAEAEVPEL